MIGSSFFSMESVDDKFVSAATGLALNTIYPRRLPRRSLAIWDRRSAGGYQCVDREHTFCHDLSKGCLLRASDIVGKQHALTGALVEDHLSWLALRTAPTNTTASRRPVDLG